MMKIKLKLSNKGEFKRCIPFLNQTANDTESIVKGSGRFFKNQLVASADNDRHGLTDVLDSSDL